MEESADFLKELKGLGKDLSQTIKDMLKSDEFKHLESEIVTAAKSISKSVVEGLKTAQKSSSANKLKKRLGRVVKAGSKEGKVRAAQAQVLATNGIKKARVAIKNLKKKEKKDDDNLS